LWSAAPAAGAAPALSGSGFVVHPEGYVVTHRSAVDLVDGPLRIEDSYTEVVLGETSYEAHMVAVDAASGLALLKIEATDLPWLPLVDLAQLELGADVRGFGRPPVWAPEQSADLSPGIISSLTLNAAGGSVAIDADVKPGNAGGPFVNLRGEVVAMIGTGEAPSAISPAAVRGLLEQAQVTPPEDPRGEELSNVELARRVSAAVAFVRTTIRRSVFPTHAGRAKVLGLIGSDLLLTQGFPSEGGGDPTVKVWDTRTGRLLGTSGTAELGIDSAAFCTRKRLLASRDVAGNLTLASTSEGPLAAWPAFSKGETQYDSVPSGVELAISADGSAVAAEWENRVKIWNVKGRLLDEITLAESRYAYPAWALSSDARQVAYTEEGPADGQYQVHLYDRQQRRVIQSHAVQYAYRLEFSPDGRWLLINGMQQFWDLRSGNLLPGLDSTDPLAMPSDRAWIISATYSFTEEAQRVWVEVWDRHRRILLGRWLTGELSGNNRPGTIGVSADGLSIATSDEATGQVRLWHLHGELEELPGITLLPRQDERPTDYGGNVVLSPRGDLAANWTSQYGDDAHDSVLFLTDLRTGAVRQRIELNLPRPPSATFSADGTRIAVARGRSTGGYDISVRDVDSGQVLRQVQFPPHDYLSLYLSAHGEVLQAVGTTNLPPPAEGQPAPVRRDYQIWDVATGEVWPDLKDETGAEATVTGATFSPDGLTLATRDEADRVLVWDAATRQLLRRFDPGERGPLGAWAYSPDGRWIAAALQGGLLMWDVATGQVVREFADPAPSADPTSRLSETLFSPAGDLLVAADARGNVLLWEVASGQYLRTLPNPTPVRTDGSPTYVMLKFAPRGNLLAGIYYVGYPESDRVVVWDPRDGTTLHLLETAPGSTPMNLEFAPDHSRLRVYSSDGTLRTHILSPAPRPSAVLEGYLARAGQRLSDRQFAPAEADHSRAIELAPWRAATYVARAETRRRQQRLGEAAADCTAALALAPEHVPALVARAQLLKEQGKTADAYVDLSAALDLDLEHAEARQARAEVLERLQDYRAAAADYDLVLEQHPSDLLGRIARGKCKSALRDFSGAIDDYSAVLNTTPAPFVEVLQWRGMAYLEVGRPTEALADLRRARDLQPTLASEIDPLIQRAEQLQAAQGPVTPQPTETPGESPPADPYANRGLIVTQEGKTQLMSGSQVVGTTEYVEVEVLRVQGGWVLVRSYEGPQGWIPQTKVVMFNQAEQYLSERIRANPNDGYAYYLRAILHKERGEFDEALADSYYAITIEFTWGGPAYNHGEILYAQGNYLAALDYFNEAIRLGPVRAEYYHSAGLARFKMKDYDRAVAAHTQAIRLRPEYREAYNDRGVAHAWWSKPAEALADFSHWRRLDPEYDAGALDLFWFDYDHQWWFASDEEAVAYTALVQGPDSQVERFVPQDALDFAQRAWIWRAKGRTARAVADLSEAITRLKDASDLAYLCRFRGWLLCEERNYAAALRDFDYVIRTTDADASFLLANLHSDRGVILMRQGDLAAAAAEFDESIRLEPDQYHAWLNRGWLRYRQGQRLAAMADYCAAWDYLSSEDWYEWGEYYYLVDPALEFHDGWSYMIGPYGGVAPPGVPPAATPAEVDERPELDPPPLDPSDAYVVTFRGDMWSLLDKYDQELADYAEAMRLDPQFALPSYRRGLHWQAVGDHSQAVEDFSAAIERQADYCLAWYARGWSQAELGHFDEAIADYDRTIELGTELAWAYHNRGQCWFRKGDAQRAIADYTEALRIDPAHVTSLTDRGAAHSFLKDYDRALADYNEAQRVAPAAAWVYDRRGDFYRTWRRYGEAQADFEEAIRRDPNLADARMNLAWLLATCPEAERRDGQQALYLARRAIELAGTKDPQHLAALAAAYAETGDFTQAVQYQSQALQAAAATDQETHGTRLQLYQAGQPCREE
jgi:tetratricopeptide (TPR) repeat protein/WD40 repeat protein